MSSPCRHRDGRGEAGDMLIHGKNRKEDNEFRDGAAPEGGGTAVHQSGSSPLKTCAGAKKQRVGVTNKLV